ncbi:MAG: PAS domain S-box protein [Nitrospiraceae bacterium]|nr:PAS domain S-box protein [Nitrospiraceae bacterium]
MAKKPDQSTKFTKFRGQAEARLRVTKRDVAAMPVKDVQQLVHELQVHQIELEMQNEELLRAQVELEAVRDRYMDLYDFSPVGYLTLDTQGTIMEANLTVGTLLGHNRNKLIGQPLARFIAPSDADRFHRHCQEVLKTGTRQTCEVLLGKEAGVSRWIYLESLMLQDETGLITHWRTALLDISDRTLAEQQLEAQRAQREEIIGATMDAIITMDEYERVVLFNRAAESIFLCPAADAIGQRFDRFIPKRLRRAHLGQMSAIAKAQATARSMGRSDTLFGLRTNGEEFPFEVSISHVRVGGQNLFTFILRDITERKIAEEALQANNAFIHSVLNSLPLQVSVLDRDGVILKTNDAWIALAQPQTYSVFTIGEVGDNYFALGRQSAAGGTSTGKAILKGINSILEGHDPIFSAEYQAQLQEEKHWFLIRVTPLKGAKGVVIAHTDISAQVRLARQLEEHMLLLDEQRAELERLTGKLIYAQEHERRRIARELHDDYNQRLAALSVDLEVIELAPVGLSEPIARQLAAIRSQVGRLSDDLHDLAYELHPSLLEHVGLEIAIRDHVAEFTKRTGLSVTCTVREVPGMIPPEVATALFRVVQESLQNVFKHAQATDVTVRLSGSSKGIGVSVRDNGKGFEVASNQAHQTGIGLTSIQERARLLGGFSRIHSCSGQGTKVCVWVPLSQEGA